MDKTIFDKVTKVKLVIDENNVIKKAYTEENNQKTYLDQNSQLLNSAITNINNDKNYVNRLLGGTGVVVGGNYTTPSNQNSTTVNIPKAASTLAAVDLNPIGTVLDAAFNNKSDYLYNPISLENENKNVALVYPLDLSKDQDRMVITMYRYRSVIRDLGSENRNLSDLSNSLEGKPLGYVILPMPNQLPDISKVQWSPNTFSAAQLAQAGGSLIGSLIKNQSINNVKDPKSAFGKEKIQEIENNFGVLSKFQGVDYDAALSRVAGVITNPNQDLLFTGNGLRTFTYQFNLFPRNKQESVEIRSIVRLFRQGMLPRKLLGSLVGAPNTFRIKFIKGGTADTPLADVRRHKELALTSFVADAVPGDVWMTYNDPDHSTIGFRVLMNFTELTPVYYNDFIGDDPNNFNNAKDINGDQIKGTIGY